MEKIIWQQIDTNWWQGNSGPRGERFWIRLSAKGTCQNKCQKKGWDERDSDDECKIIKMEPKYIGWKVGGAIIYWFNTLRECKEELEKTYG
jgi:hypothetical protein